MTVLLAAGVLSWGAAPALAQEEPPPRPPTLTGEVFFGDATSVEIDCNLDPTGQTLSTLEVTASGEATGPYPGPFTETARAVWQQRIFNEGPVNTMLSYDVDFTIDSPVGRVTGTKRLPSVDPDTTANCVRNEFGETASVAAGLEYTATLHTDLGDFIDQGMAASGALGSLNPSGGIVFGGIDEEFRSREAEPIPVDRGVPKDKRDCKQRFAFFGFKNRGDCVAFLATKGRNSASSRGRPRRR